MLMTCAAAGPPGASTSFASRGSGIRVSLAPPSCRAGRSRSRAAVFKTSSLASSCADPMCSMSRDPRRDEQTIWTAVAPDAAFTVRGYADAGPTLYRPGLVRNFSDHEPQALWTAKRVTSEDRRPCHDRRF